MQPFSQILWNTLHAYVFLWSTEREKNNGLFFLQGNSTMYENVSFFVFENNWIFPCVIVEKRRHIACIISFLYAIYYSFFLDIITELVPCFHEWKSYVKTIYRHFAPHLLTKLPRYCRLKLDSIFILIFVVKVLNTCVPLTNP